MPRVVSLTPARSTPMIGGMIGGGSLSLLPLARRVRPWFETRPRAASWLEPYYLAAECSLTAYLKHRCPPGVSAGVLRHRGWIPGRSDIDPLFWIDDRGLGPAVLAEEASDLRRFWSAYSRLRAVFPILASHWELKILNFREEAHHPALDGPETALLYQPQDWAPILGGPRVERLRASWSETAKRDELRHPCARIVDFKLNSVLLAHWWRRGWPEARTLSRRGFERTLSWLEAWLGAEPCADATGVERLSRLVDSYDAWLARLPGLSDRGALPRGSRPERGTPAWMSAALKAALSELEAALPPELSVVAYRTTTPWCPIRVALIAEDFDSFPKHSESLRRAAASLLAEGVEISLATPRILDAHCRGMSEWDPREPELRARAGVYDSAGVHPYGSVDESIRLRRKRQLAADLLEGFVPRLLHPELERSPLSDLREFDAYFGGFEADPATSRLSGADAYAEVTPVLARFLRDSRPQVGAR